MHDQPLYNISINRYNFQYDVDRILPVFYISYGYFACLITFKPFIQLYWADIQISVLRVKWSQQLLICNTVFISVSMCLKTLYGLLRAYVESQDLIKAKYIFHRMPTLSRVGDWSKRMRKQAHLHTEYAGTDFHCWALPEGPGNF